MKRLLCLLLVLCLVLVGCGKKTAEEPVPSTEAPTTAATTPPATTEETEPPTTEETEPAPTEPPALVHPLTGEPLEDYFTGRPVAFSLNNISACLPQYGLSNLDWLFEVETEGGITRCVGIMTHPENADIVGPIRSCRTYFVNLSVSYNAPLFHCGTSHFVDNNQYSFTDSLSSWDHFDQMGAGSPYFYRETSRNDQYDFEHTLFTTGSLMAEAMEDTGLNDTNGQPLNYGYKFSQDVQLEGQSANSVDIEFQWGKTTTMEYDSESGLYLAHQYGEDWIDGATGENAAFRNLLVISTVQTHVDSGHSFYELDGTGDGYFAVGGQMIPIKWHHEGVEGPFRFTLEDGTPITLGVGKTYCAIIDTTGSVTAE